MFLYLGLFVCFTLVPALQTWLTSSVSSNWSQLTLWHCIPTPSPPPCAHENTIVLKSKTKTEKCTHKSSMVYIHKFCALLTLWTRKQKYSSYSQESTSVPSNAEALFLRGSKHLSVINQCCLTQLYLQADWCNRKIKSSALISSTTYLNLVQRS